MKIRAILILVLFFGGFNLANAQNGWNWPEDRQTAERKNALYNDALRNDNYRKAADELSWLLINAPDINPAIYINGANIYEGLAENADDPTKREVYQDSALLMYDLRIKYFDNEKEVLDRKAYQAYKYHRDDAQKYEELLKLFEKVFGMNGNNVLGINTIAYMDVLRRHELSKKEEGLSDEEVLKRYDQIISVLDNKISQGKNVERLEGYRDKIDAMLSQIVTIDCDYIEQKLGPKFKANPDDLELGKKIISYSLAASCTDSPLFLEAAKAVFEKEPNYSMAKVIALKSKIEGNYDVAMKYFEEALTLTESGTEKGDIYLAMADMAKSRGRKSPARNFALKAVAADPSKKEAYTFVGHLYFQSYDECRQGENKVKDRAVFLAAYEMYQKAGNSRAMQNAKEQFPSAEVIFTYNMEVGQTIRVDCWINKTVTIRKRD